MSHCLRLARTFQGDDLLANQKYDTNCVLIGEVAVVEHAPRNLKKMHVKLVSTLSLY